MTIPELEPLAEEIVSAEEDAAYTAWLRAKVREAELDSGLASRMRR